MRNFILSFVLGFVLVLLIIAPFYSLTLDKDKEIKELKEQLQSEKTGREMDKNAKCGIDDSNTFITKYVYEIKNGSGKLLRIETEKALDNWDGTLFEFNNK